MSHLTNQRCNYAFRALVLYMLVLCHTVMDYCDTLNGTEPLLKLLVTPVKMSALGVIYKAVLKSVSISLKQKI